LNVKTKHALASPYSFGAADVEEPFKEQIADCKIFVVFTITNVGFKLYYHDMYFLNWHRADALFYPPSS
jgi:hypothetical protein